MTPDGHAAKSVNGVQIFDRTVAWRVRTDEDFSREFTRPDPLGDAMKTTTTTGTFAYRPGKGSGKFTLTTA